MSNIDINSLGGSQGVLPEMLQLSGSEFSLQLVLSYYPPKFFQTTRHVLLVLKVIAFRARGDGLDIITVNGCG